MKKYTQLTLIERGQIEILLKANHNHKYIADALGRSQPTISREISRNTINNEGYQSIRAHYRYYERLSTQRKSAPQKDQWVWEYCIKKLKRRWSPETISGRLRQEYGVSIHFETIYRYIYSIEGQRNELYQYLTRHRKRRMKNYGRKVKSAPIKDRTMIDQRPLLEGFGNWETDNMEGVRSDKQVVSVTGEKISKYLTGSLCSKKSASKTHHIVDRLWGHTVKTITTDNGAENAEHKLWEYVLNTKVYFCAAYHSWEKGFIENSIGVLRRWIPKKQSIEWLTESQLQRILQEYNNMPRKTLNYLTPKEVFMSKS